MEHKFETRARDHKSVDIKKSLFGGYTKESVNAYIESTEKLLVSIQRSLQKQLDSAINEKLILKEENRILIDQNNELSEYIGRLKETILEQGSHIEDLEENLKAVTHQYNEALSLLDHVEERHAVETNDSLPYVQDTKGQEPQYFVKHEGQADPAEELEVFDIEAIMASLKAHRDLLKKFE